MSQTQEVKKVKYHDTHEKVEKEGCPQPSMKEVHDLISFTKNTFSSHLSKALNLTKVAAPLFVTSESGLNDNLNYIETPVKFITSSQDDCVIVHSLAKWKREALRKYGDSIKGLYTDMNAIRKQEDVETMLESNMHSYYVDQWDWEKKIEKDERTVEYLKETVIKIYESILKTQEEIIKEYKIENKNILPKEITFITSQELEDLYPSISPSEREYEYVKVKKAVFIIGIGHNLKSGEPHGKRSDDYDDWSLNGDLVFYNAVIDREHEISSMGIRVDKEALEKQCGIRKNVLTKYQYHKDIISGDMPFTIGGGIGQSRLVMFLLNKKHIGEVQSSVWPKEVKDKMLKENIHLL